MAQDSIFLFVFFCLFIFFFFLNLTQIAQSIFGLAALYMIYFVVFIKHLYETVNTLQKHTSFDFAAACKELLLHQEAVRGLPEEKAYRNTFIGV